MSQQLIKVPPTKNTLLRLKRPGTTCSSASATC